MTDTVTVDIVISEVTVALPGAIGGPGGGSGSAWLTGSTVPDNSLGVDGDMYLRTTNGQYYKKVTGAWVSQGNLTGPAGSSGSNGADGATWYTGVVAPSGGLGKDGDFFINSVTDEYYQKVSGSWSLIGDATGKDGPTGANGTNGTNGATWLSGSGAPAGGTGVVNDFYIDTATGNYYKKTGASTWTLQGTFALINTVELHTYVMTRAFLLR